MPGAVAATAGSVVEGLWGVPEQSIQAETMSRLDGKPRNVVPGFREGGERDTTDVLPNDTGATGESPHGPEIRRDGERLNQKRRWTCLTVVTWSRIATRW